ncbi:MAG: hypothetical protein QXW40_00975 [Thermofilum sp.]
MRVMRLSLEEVRLLCRRAEGFLRNAEHLISVGEWDLAAFSSLSSASCSWRRAPARGRAP